MISRNNEIKRCLHEITSWFFFQFFVRISKNLVGKIYYFIITTYKVFPKTQFFVRETYFLVFTISNILIFTPYCTTHYLICASQFMCLYTTYNLAITTYYLICAPYHFVCTKTICRLARNNFNITHCMSENLEATQRIFFWFTVMTLPATFIQYLYQPDPLESQDYEQQRESTILKRDIDLQRVWDILRFKSISHMRLKYIS